MRRRKPINKNSIIKLYYIKTQNKSKINQYHKKSKINTKQKRRAKNQDKRKKEANCSVGCWLTIVASIISLKCQFKILALIRLFSSPKNAFKEFLQKKEKN